MFSGVLVWDFWYGLFYRWSGRALDFLAARVITMPYHLNVNQDISKTHIRFSDVYLKTPLKATFMHQVLFSDHHLQCCIRESGVYVELPKLIGKGIRFMAFWKSAFCKWGHCRRLGFKLYWSTGISPRFLEFCPVFASDTSSGFTFVVSSLLITKTIFSLDFLVISLPLLSWVSRVLEYWICL